MEALLVLAVLLVFFAFPVSISLLVMLLQHPCFVKHDWKDESWAINDPTAATGIYRQCTRCGYKQIVQTPY